MSCCGQTAAQALAAAQHTLDARTAAQTHVRLVYIGQDKRVRPFVAAGKVYQFGNNDRQRANVVGAAAVQKLMATKQFELFDPERHNEDGTLKAEQGGPEGTPGHPSTSLRTSGAGEQPPDVTNPAAATNLQPRETLQTASLRQGGRFATVPSGLPHNAEVAVPGENTPELTPPLASAPPVQPAAIVRAKPAASKK